MKRKQPAAEVCNNCNKPRLASVEATLDPECLEHDSCEKCSVWCYAYNDQDCEHTAVYRANADLRAELAAAKRDGVLTEALRDLASTLGCSREATADAVARRADAEVRRLRQAVAAYAAAAEVDDDCA